MIEIGIKEAKDNLSGLLARVKAGEEVLITDRGKPVARLVREEESGRAIRTALAPLVQQGIVTPPSRAVSKTGVRPLRAPGRPVGEMVAEDRR